MNIHKAVIDTMLDTMKKRLGDDMHVIRDFAISQPDPYRNGMSKRHCLPYNQGQYSGLNRVVLEIENIMRN
jgi:hypothetical protein